MSELAAQKASLRRAVRAEGKALTPPFLMESDLALWQHARHYAPLWEAHTVFLYAGNGFEPNTRPIFEELLRRGARVCLPLCRDGGRMEARQVTSWRALVPGPWDILQPRDDAPLVPFEEIPLALVPGLLFDRQGYRLGQGGGYYDRFLATYRGGTFALCRDLFLYDTLPLSSHDRPVDAVLTETRLFPPAKRGED